MPVGREGVLLALIPGAVMRRHDVGIQGDRLGRQPVKENDAADGEACLRLWTEDALERLVVEPRPVARIATGEPLEAGAGDIRRAEIVAPGKAILHRMIAPKSGDETPSGRPPKTAACLRLGEVFEALDGFRHERAIADLFLRLAGANIGDLRDPVALAAVAGKAGPVWFPAIAKLVVPEACISCISGSR